MSGLLVFIIGSESINGTLQNTPNLISMSVGNVSETGLVGAGDATYGTNGQVAPAITLYIILKEIVEILHHNLLH